jgi:uncharacterized membrane protein YbhN (UPF0104 family)
LLWLIHGRKLLAVSEAAVLARPVRRWLRWVLPIAAAVIIYFTLWDRLPTWDDFADAVRGARPGWLAAAAIFELWSLGMFARQQRRLLRAFGVHLTLPRAMAITLSRSAISISLPAGSAISAAFAFQQFRAKGASRGVATAVMILSGFVSFAGLGLLYLVGGTVSGVISVCAVLAVAAALLGGGSLLWRRWRPDPATRIGALVTAAHEIRSRHWMLALAFAIVNWFADLMCLIAVVHAFSLTIPITAVAGTYLGVQIIRQIPLTPGGIGVIEASLITGLVGAGASDAGASAAVLGYRILSCWLIIPIGLLAWTALRRKKDSGDQVSAT